MPITNNLAALVNRLSDALDKARIERDEYRVRLAETEFNLDRMRLRVRALESAARADAKKSKG